MTITYQHDFLSADDARLTAARLLDLNHSFRLYPQGLHAEDTTHVMTHTVWWNGQEFSPLNGLASSICWRWVCDNQQRELEYINTIDLDLIAPRSNPLYYHSRGTTDHNNTKLFYCAGGSGKITVFNETTYDCDVRGSLTVREEIEITANSLVQVPANQHLMITGSDSVWLALVFAELRSRDK